MNIWDLLKTGGGKPFGNSPSLYPIYIKGYLRNTTNENTVSVLPRSSMPP